MAEKKKSRINEGLRSAQGMMVSTAELKRLLGESLSTGPTVTVDQGGRSRHVGLNVPREGTSNEEISARRRARRKAGRKRPAGGR